MKDDNSRAAILMMTGSCAFAVNDTFLKLLGAEIGLFQIILLRGVAVSLLFAAMVIQARVAFRSLTAPDRLALALRSMAEAAAAYFFLTALFNMPLANVTAIIQVVPLTVTLAAWLVLKEPVGWRRLLAILIGFCGVLLIVKPGTDAFTGASIHAVMAVGMVTLRDLLTRRMAVAVPSSLVALTSAVGVTLFGAMGAMTQDWVRMDLQAWGLLAGAVVAVFLAYYLVILAMRGGDISFAAPFRYAALPAAILLGWFVLGEWPDSLTFLGSGIVVATGPYTLLRERQLQRRAMPARG